MDTTTVSSSGARKMRPRSSQANSITDRDKTIARYNGDAQLLAEFEKTTESGESFNYSRSVLQSCHQSVPEEQITAYLSIIQRGGLIQPFGCLIVVEETSLKIICYSENCSDLLGLNSQLELTHAKTLIGIDVRTLFTPSSSTSLAKAAVSREISFLNPIWVYSNTSQNPFYAILHRIDVGIVIDLEPAKSGDPALSLAGAVQSQKLAVQAISRLQSLPGGDIGALCDAVVEDVQKLTGYDRVMAYKFHDDDHGEVVSELRRSDLEPYLGLHYPSTDVPQAARFLFKQNRVRMICDCHAKPIKIIQSEKLKHSLCLVNSTLRSPYGCHAQYMINMGSIASLVMAVLVSSNKGKKLWGLVVCHHTSPRYLPFPLRYACELLMQAFGLRLHMEFQLASQLMEKNILKTQTLISDMLLQEGPRSLVTQSPNIMDLVKCDGAALYYNGTCWLLGVTPSETQVMDIAAWLLNEHQDSTGLSTDTLADSGYPEAASLRDTVCGMVAARINSKDFLFWFRSRAAKEVKWAGAKHQPEYEDEGGKLHPRSSYNAFLEVVKNRSFPWEFSEINAIHTMQLIVRDSLQNFKDTSTEGHITAQVSDSETQRLVDELSSDTWEMLRLIETATVPIFGVDSAGLINGWNAKISELTGLESTNAMGKSLVNEVTHEDSRQTVASVLVRALKGEEERDVELKLRSFTCDRRESSLYIVVNSCTSRDYKNQVIGVCFVGLDITPEKIVMDKFIQFQGDYKAIIHSLNPFFPPIFASDVNACCSEWNAAMEKLTGWKRDEVMGKILPGEVFGTFCRLKGQDTMTKFMISLYRSILGQETEELPFGFFNRKGRFVKVLLTANKRADGAGDIIGCLCFLQIADPVAEEHGEDEGESFLQLTELAYIRQEINNPLNGIRLIHKLLESSCIDENQKLLLNTCHSCEKQIMTIMEDNNLRTIGGGSIELIDEEFLLGDVLDAIIGQIMIPVTKKQLQLRQEIHEDIESLILYGDQIKLQLVLSDFLLNVVNYTPSGGWVGIDISQRSTSIKDGQKNIHFQVRMTHSGEGLPSTLIQEMFGEGEQCKSHEGLGLNLSRELLSKMNGNVHYVREHNQSYFLVDLEFQTKGDVPENPKPETIDQIIPS